MSLLSNFEAKAAAEEARLKILRAIQIQMAYRVHLLSRRVRMRVLAKARREEKQCVRSRRRWQIASGAQKLDYGVRHFGSSNALNLNRN